MNTFNKTKKQQLKRKKEIMQIIRKKNQNKNAEINDLKINNSKKKELLQSNTKIK